MPDADYDLRFFGVDEARSSVAACAVFTGTHTGEGGSVPPNGRSMRTDASTSWSSTAARSGT
jgi:hypothetical protein